MKSIGIEIGTSKSCIGFEEAGDIKIIPNAFGEGIVPSVVSISKNKIYAGIDANISKISNCTHTISEIKRLLGKIYSKKNLEFENYKKYLSYDLIEEEDKPILIKIDDNIFTPEEIYAYLIKKLIDNGSSHNIFRRKVMITIPDCFGLVKRKLIKKAAKLAGIDISKLEFIRESYASALAFEIYINKRNEKLKYKYNYEIFLLENKNKISEDIASSPASLINNTNKLSIIFDLGGGYFNLTLLSIQQKDNKIEFDIRESLGDQNFGCVDFDNNLVNYCIKDFCKNFKFNEEEIYKDKKSIQRLKFKCEIAKKILSKRDHVVINVDNFFGNNDLCCFILREKFDLICADLYKKINNKLDELLKITNLTPNDINEVLLIGGSTKIPKIKNILIEKFSLKKLIYNLDKDKITINGAVLFACEMEKKNKSIILNNTLSLPLGISILNDDCSSFLKNGNKMYTILKKNSKLPIREKKKFKIILPKNKKVNLHFYEGDNEFVKNNEKIYDLNIEIPSANAGDTINYDITLEVDINYILKIKVDIPSLTPMEVEIGNLDQNEEKLKLKKRLQTKEIKFDFEKTKNELSEYADQLEKFKGADKNKVLINCCECCNDILKAYEEYYNREDVIENIFLATRNLFFYYLQRFKLKSIEIDDSENMISTIKDKIKNVIKTVGYAENLLEVFKDICKVDKKIFYEIMIDYIELMNNEGVNLLMKKNKTRKNYAKIYFRSCFFIIKKIEKEIDFSGMSEELNQKYEIQKKINEFSIELINTRENEDKSAKFNNLRKIIDSLNNTKYKWLKDPLLLIQELQNEYDLLNKDD